MKRLLLCFTLSTFPLIAFPSVIPDRSAIDAIIGETNQTSAMLPIACAIRARSSLQGIYGLHNPVVKHASPAMRARAAQAWHASQYSAANHGCKYFGCPTSGVIRVPVPAAPSKRTNSRRFRRDFTFTVILLPQ
jgi:hypothetical protein